MSKSKEERRLAKKLANIRKIPRNPFQRALRSGAVTGGGVHRRSHVRGVERGKAIKESGEHE